MENTTLKPYADYKPSGVEWLSDVPAHWDVQKLRHILSDVAERNRPDLPLLSVVREQGVILRNIDDKEENHNFIPDDLSNYKVVNSDQFAMNKMKAWQGSFGVSEHNGIVSPAYFIFDLRNAQPRFFHVAIRSKAYVSFFGQASDGVRIGQWDLSKVRMREIPFFTPPFEEQTAIVRYLDHAADRIHRAISAKKRLIELLTEQRQAVVHRAITRGLDPNVPLKSSGVEWLGDVPDHWDMRRLKSVCSRIVGGSTPKSDVAAYWGGEVNWVTPTDVSKVSRLRSSLRKITRAGLLSCSTEIVPAGSIVVTTRAPVGNIALAETELCTNQGCKSLVVSNEAINPEYAYNLLNVMKPELQSLAMGTTFTELGTGVLGDIPIPLPPLSEQTAITCYLDKITADIDTAIDKAQRQIDLLREYRTRLIADVVTGQVDVRGAVQDEVELPVS